MSRKLDLEDLKEFISNWSDKKMDETRFDELFTVEGMPLSWFYRPILYSSLLPRPFPTASDIFARRKISLFKIKICSFLLRRYLPINDWVKRRITSKKNSNEMSETVDRDKIEKILFLTFTTYFDEDPKKDFRMKSIIEKIEKSGKYQPLLLTADPISSLSLRKMRKVGQASPILYHYYDKAIASRSKKEAQEFARKWKSLTTEQKKGLCDPWEESEVIKEENKLYPYLRPALDLLYSAEFITAVWKYYLTFRKIIVREKVEGIVLSSQNNIFEKCLIAAARKESTSVFVIQHGIGLGTLRTIDTPENVKFAVFGEKYRQELVGLGVDKKNSVITGPIIFDGIEKYVGRKEESGEGKKNTTISDKPDKKILLATSPFIEDRFLTKEDYFQRVKNVLMQLSSITKNINLKLHPREKNITEYQSLIKYLNINGIVTSDPNRDKHYELIKDCDLVINFGSTVALEAMIIERPTLTIDLFDSHNPTNNLIINSGASTVVKYDFPFVEVAKSLLTKDPKKKQAKKFIKSLCYKVDGKASQRIVKYIYTEIEKEKIEKKKNE